MLSLLGALGIVGAGAAATAGGGYWVSRILTNKNAETQKKLVDYEAEKLGKRVTMDDLMKELKK